MMSGRSLDRHSLARDAASTGTGCQAGSPPPVGPIRYTEDPVALMRATEWTPDAPSQSWKAIAEPSGDHAGLDASHVALAARYTSGQSVRRVGVPPSTPTTQMF